MSLVEEGPKPFFLSTTPYVGVDSGMPGIAMLPTSPPHGSNRSLLHIANILHFQHVGSIIKICVREGIGTGVIGHNIWCTFWFSLQNYDGLFLVQNLPYFLRQLIHSEWLLNKTVTASLQYLGGLSVNAVAT